MTNQDRQQIEKDVLYEAETTRRDYELQKAKLAQWGRHLEELGAALQSRPESVSPIPEIGSADHRPGINLLGKREEIIEAIATLQSLRQKANIAAQRKTAIGFSSN